MKSNLRGAIPIAQWDNGWTLERMVDAHAASELGLRDPITRPVFALRDAEDHLVYQLVYNQLQHRFSNDYLHVMLAEQDAPFPDAGARQICLSAITEVLGLPISNRFLYKSPLLIPLFREETWHALAEENKELPPVAEKLAAMHDAQMALRKPQREELGKTRKLFTNLAIRNFRWVLNLNRFRSPKMLEYDSYPSKAEVAREVAKGVGIIQGTSYQLVLQLDFTPDPSWSVRVEQEYRTREDWMPYEELVTGAIGPVHALVQAGIVAPLENDAEGTIVKRVHASSERWLDQRLETAPEFVERFDTEPYRLLDTELPYLWSLDDFLPWALSGDADAR